MLIGVTGQIGAGKSAVCAEFDRLGASLVDADDFGKQVSGSLAILQKLVKHFGPTIRSKSGKLRPKALGEIVFGDESGHALIYLNQVVQPKLHRVLRAEIKKLRKSAANSAVILDAAILPAWDMINDCDVVITVVASKAVRLRRLQKRGISREVALSRMSAQLSQRAYIAAADIVIHNDSTKRELISRVRRIWRSRISCS
ncbi:dephospho-CoA kinase [Gemmatimonas aurantiaca]|nr:dephospho-CoA kinase [Gemmatimonas aurantiaca]